MALVFVLTASQLVPCCADLCGAQVLRPGAEDLFSVTGTDEADSAQDDLDSSQKNAIAMLNYIAVLTQEINSSRNSRLHMEDAYSGQQYESECGGQQDPGEGELPSGSDGKIPHDEIQEGPPESHF